MASNLLEIPLSEIVTIKGGKRLPAGKNLQSTPSNHPYIRVRDVGQRSLPREGLEYVPDDVFPSISRYIVQENDIVLSIVGTIGALSIVNAFYNSASLTENCVKLTGLDYHDALFLYYYLTSSLGQQEISQGTVGAVQPKLPIYSIEKIKVLWPDDKKERQIIASVLGRLDDKIELNRRINQNLEAMAQALFKSWFVDFDPIKAKIAALAEGRDPLRAAMSVISGKPDAELDTLSPERYEKLAATAALFPNEMEEADLGEIPRGWAFNSVADIAQFASGKVDVSLLNEDIYVSTENMLENRAGVTRATSLPSVASVPSFKMGHILISNIRPYFKKIWMAHLDGGRSPDVLAFESTDPQWAEFLYNLMYQDTFFEFMTRTAKGAKMPRGDKDAIMGWRFPCPNEPLMVVFSEKVKPHYAHIESLVSQSKSLTELRETLLPKLLSGELSMAEENVVAGI